MAVSGLTWQVDRLVLAPAPDAAQTVAPTPDPVHSELEPGRVFVFLIDSLRFDLANDPTTMPTTSGLASHSVHARMRPSRDATTVSGARAIFTGRDHFTVFGFVDNFARRARQRESIFAQLDHVGRRSLVFSDGTFAQFSEHGLHRRAYVEPAELATGQASTVRQAIAAFSAGEADLVVAHVTHTDHVSHATPVGSASYHQAFTWADGLVAEILAELPPDASLMVLGDHGHDDRGVHMVGLDVPTFVAVRGPRFRPGVDLGTVPMTDARYLLSFALGLPLPVDYASGRHPEALRSNTPLPPAYAQPYDALSLQPGPEGIPQRDTWPLRLVILCFGVFVAIWFAILRSVTEPAHPPGFLVAAGWIVALALWFEGVAEWVPASVGVLLGVAALAHFARSRGATRVEWAWAVAPILGCLALYAWGILLGAGRASFHYPHITSLARAWLVGIGVAGLVAWRFGLMRGAWLLMLPFVLAYPTTYCYGAPGSMAQAWLGWLALTLLFAEKRRAPHRFSRAALVGLPVGIILLVQPFAFPESMLFEFQRFNAWLPWLKPYNRGEWLTVLLLTKPVLFWRPGNTRHATLVGFGVALTVLTVQMGWWPPHHRATLLVAAAFGIVAVFAHRSAARPEHHTYAYLLGLGCALLAFMHLVRVEWRYAMWLDMLLAALVLSARLVARFERETQHESAHTYLMVLGLMAAGWSTVAWTAHGAEWGFLYDWMSPETAERNAAWVVPLILARYALPLIAFRLVMRRELGPLDGPRRQRIWLVVGVKTFSLVVIMAGLAVAVPASSVHLESVLQLAVLAGLLTGLL